MQDSIWNDQQHIRKFSFRFVSISFVIRIRWWMALLFDFCARKGKEGSPKRDPFWVYWWQSTGATAGDVKPEHIHYELNTDFEASLMSAAEMQALVPAWQSGAVSRDTLQHNFRTGEILPSARTNEQEMELIRREQGAQLFVRSPS